MTIIANDLRFTVNDTAPALTGTLSASLVGATATAHIKRPDKTVLTKPVTITDAANGGWSVTWAAGDLSVSGTYYVEVQVTYSDTTVQTFAYDAQGVAQFYVRNEYA
jgi:hypothetical protein